MKSNTVGATLEEVVATEGERLLLVMEREVLTRYGVPANRALRIGRAASCDVVLRDPLASRAHAVLYTENGLHVEDAGSHNGTRVRNERIRPGARVAVEIGDPIQIGSALLIVHRVNRAPGQRVAWPGGEAPAGEGLSDEDEGESVLADGGAGQRVVVRDPAMRLVYSLVKRVAPSNINVLVSGETGVGKELVAEALHRESEARSTGPFVRINCAALSEALFESELFGHERGAFTGAVRTKRGLLEAAHLGTVFLDEVGELSLGAQAKLLRVLESRQVTRVGGLVPQPIDVRFVAATNRDLKAEVARGAFREDLFFRLTGVKVVIPPLRERSSEIAPLADELMFATASTLGRPIPTFSPTARECLESYGWPGNIRELRNVVESALLRCEGGEVRPEDLPEELRRSVDDDSASAVILKSVRPLESSSPSEASDALNARQLEERARILEGLAACNGNQTRAAALLGMPRRTLVYKLAAYAIPRPRC